MKCPIEDCGESLLDEKQLYQHLMDRGYYRIHTKHFITKALVKLIAADMIPRAKVEAKIAERMELAKKACTMDGSPQDITAKHWIDAMTWFQDLLSLVVAEKFQKI